ncbi:MAG: class I SAM-dependent methyltransferase [Bacteroidales bacterium]|nr:class I SAM-dependent methyltransferase [Bacteroidales bacterium]
MSFDDDARNWDNDPAKVERAGLLAQEIRNVVQPDGTTDAFEFGCGTGLLSFFLKDDFRSITLADTSQGMIDVLREKITSSHIDTMHPLLIDLLEEEKNISPVQTIYTLMTLHHIKEVSSLLRIFNSMLLPGGYLCIGDLEPEDGSFHFRHPHFDGHRGFERDVLENKFREHGFDPVYYKTFYTIRRIVNGQERSYPLFVLIGRKL